MLPVNRIVLGTTKFGMPYGCSDGQQVPEDVTKKIFQASQSLGIDLYDTAPSYGMSEQLIGYYLQSKQAGVFSNEDKANSKVVTKVAKVESDSINVKDIQNVQSVFDHSLKVMQCESCYGLLVHDVKDLFKENSTLLIDWMQELKVSKRVKKIGVSVYTPQEAEELLRFFDFDLIQLPCNLFDQRFILSGTLDVLAKKGVEIHARSLFLKGVILKPENQVDLPSDLVTHNKLFHESLSREGVSAYDVCVAFANQQVLIDRWVIGVSSEKQLNQLFNQPCEDANKSGISKSMFDFSRWAFTDAVLLDPRLW